MNKRQMDLESTPYVAVYGTLKEGGTNNPLLKGSKRVLTGVVYGKGTLLNTWPPTFSTEESQHPFLVEVYEVNEETLMRLDALEGHPSGYYRTQVNVYVDNIIGLRAWCYFLYSSYTGDPAPLVDTEVGKEAHSWQE